eukprot:TRINITY_DN3138_c0_g2_i1.p1 TRINITY_DN3138_c0_g2~~TRINITY_DN3138_c0_g2_i1.p1  ORF type:complete len:328 (+),score=60.59 TRINITY_DN3138_c0_g2_i1:83-1066(+)
MGASLGCAPDRRKSSVHAHAQPQQRPRSASTSTSDDSPPSGAANGARGPQRPAAQPGQQRNSLRKQPPPPPQQSPQPLWREQQHSPPRAAPAEHGAGGDGDRGGARAQPPGCHRPAQPPEPPEGPAPQPAPAETPPPPRPESPDIDEFDGDDSAVAEDGGPSPLYHDEPPPSLDTVRALMGGAPLAPAAQTRNSVPKGGGVRSNSPRRTSSKQPSRGEDVGAGLGAVAPPATNYGTSSRSAATQNYIDNDFGSSSGSSDFAMPEEQAPCDNPFSGALPPVTGVIGRGVGAKGKGAPLSEPPQKLFDANDLDDDEWELPQEQGKAEGF